MTHDETYNGWPNRETWAVALHLDNNAEWRNALDDLLSDEDELSAADTLKAWFDEVQTLVTEANATAARDDAHAWLVALLDIGSLWRVHWLAVARHLRGEPSGETGDTSYDGRST